jgi:hypothetical protein
MEDQNTNLDNIQDAINNISLPPKVDKGALSRRGRKKQPNHYWTEETEKAVIAYIETQEKGLKNEIYTKYLHETINKLIDGLIQKYASGNKRHIGHCGLEELRARMYLQVFNSIEGFDKNLVGKNGTPVRAYSYLGTIANNFLKNHSKTSYKLESKNDNIEAYNTSYLDEQIKEEHYKTRDPDEVDAIDLIIEHTIEALKKEVKTNITLKEMDIKIANAIVVILENFDYYFSEPSENDTPLEYTKRGKIKKIKYSNNYAKNKVFFILKDITGLETKDIKQALTKFKTLYQETKKTIFD